MVATWNVCTTDDRGTNSAGHAEYLLPFATKQNSGYICDFIALRETRGHEKTTFQAPVAGHVIRCSCHSGGGRGISGILGGSLAIKKVMVSELGPEDVVAEQINARMLKMRIVFRREPSSWCMLLKEQPRVTRSRAAFSSIAEVAPTST